MKQNVSLQILLDLSAKASDEAALRLGKAMKEHEHALKQLDILRDYRNTYGDELQIHTSQGLNILHYHNYQNFLNNLDKAIHQQLQNIAGKLKLVEFARKDWQVCEQKRLSFTKLDERQRLAFKIRADKIEQKLNDEFSNRAQQVKL